MTKNKKQYQHPHQNQSNRNIGSVVKTRMLAPSLLNSSQAYQRPLNGRIVKLIKDSFLPELVNPIKVSLRNGRYYVFDGQHTLAALVEMFGDKSPVPCIVYEGLTYEREALLFARQDEFKTKLAARDELKALYEGNDKDVVAFVKAIESVGFVCKFNNQRSGRNIGNVKYAFDNVYIKKGKDHLVELLSIINEAYPDDKNATADLFVKGLDYFITLYKGEYDRNRLIKQLSSISPIVIIRNGKADMTHTGAARFAVQIFDVYNKMSKKSRLQSKF